MHECLFRTIGRPAIASLEASGDLILAWQAPDNRLVWSSYHAGSGWTAQRAAGQTTSHGPVLTTLGDTVYMVWKALEDDRIWWAHLAGSSWVGMGPIPVAAGAARTSDTPSLIVKGNGLLMAWKGVQVLAGMDCGARRLFSMLASIQTRVRLSQAIGCSSSRVFSWVSWHIPSILSLNVVHDVADTRLMQSLR